MDLGEYERVKFALADILRGLALADIHRGGSGPGQLRDLFARLAEDRFNVAVVGRFNRGKTSLMNAMLGMDRLPTGVVPLTSVITAVSYGSVPKAVLHYQHTSLFMDVSLEELPRHITERGNPGNVQGVSVAEVQLPADILRLGFHFIDTPGLGSAIAENTRTTEHYLPEVDALILVTSYDSPLTQEECRILEQARTDKRTVFIVVNKQDAVDAGQRQEILAHAQAALARIFGERPPLPFSVSATQALAARLRGDEAALAASGLPAFEQALMRFLVEERRLAFLAGFCTRLEAVLRQGGADAQLGELAKVRAGFVKTASPGAAATASLPVSTAPLATCEVCTALGDAVFQFLSHFQLDLYGDHGAQGKLAARGGLCRAHLHELQRLAAPREVATGFAPVLAARAAALRGLAQQGLPDALASRVAAAAQPAAGGCLVCEAVAPVGRSVLRRWHAMAVQHGAASIFRQSAPCMPHFAALLRLVADANLARELLALEAALLERLEGDLRRMSLKQDAAQRYAASAEELAAPRRALLALTGEPAALLSCDILGAGGG